MTSQRDEHPYTALLTHTDERGSYVPKVIVLLSDGSHRSLRPKWVGMYYGQQVNAWCVQRWGCAQKLVRDEDRREWRTL